MFALLYSLEQRIGWKRDLCTVLDVVNGYHEIKSVKNNKLLSHFLKYIFVYIKLLLYGKISWREFYFYFLDYNLYKYWAFSHRKEKLPLFFKLYLIRVMKSVLISKDNYNSIFLRSLLPIFKCIASRLNQYLYVSISGLYLLVYTMQANLSHLFK